MTIKTNSRSTRSSSSALCPTTTITSMSTLAMLHMFLLLTRSTVCAFVVKHSQSHVANTPSFSFKNKNDFKIRYHHGRSTILPSTTSSSWSSSSSSSILNMGLMEDIIERRDNADRKSENDKYIAYLQQRVERINSLESSVEDLDDDELISKTIDFRNRLENGEDINGNILEEAYAVVREASWRVLELRHYDVQLLGGLVLHDGRLAEMCTGEGKTLVATLPAYINALLPNKSSFIITVNDYLAKRDMEKMGQIFRYLGLSVGLIQSNMNEEQRRIAYQCDVVYVTNSELGFDYLRDHLAVSGEQTVLPRANIGEFDGFCVVDEADSVLIDEARTPLIISKQVPAPANKFAIANQLGNALKENIHYKVDQKNKNIVLTESGYIDSEKALGVNNLFTIQKDGEAWAPFVNNAIKAKELFNKDKEYSIIQDPITKANIGVGIIDSFTGRVLDGRRWSDGLHQSIEAKEGITVSEQSKVIAKVTYQSLFRQFTRLSGMTGTAMSDASELELVYNLKVTPIPTALPIARRDYPDVAYKTRLAANNALMKEAIAVSQGKDEDGNIVGGRPCLIGTTSVEQSEALVTAFKEKGVMNVELLNASPKNAPRESEIIAQAGRAGVITVATNMAGRGTDILLGGCSTTMSRIQTRSYLLKEGVLKSEEMDLLAPSPTDDYYPCSLTSHVEQSLKAAAVAVKTAFGDDMTGIQLDELLTVAFDTTETEDDPDHLVKLREAASAVKEVYEPVLAAEKETVKSLGGLYVMGTNRHESSRIDRQLRGRAGRQGDPGSSRFFLSFEDDMFLTFGADNLKDMLARFRVSDDMPIEAPQITEALDRVQYAVEDKFREIRGQIFDFDDILNSQRKVIYTRRRKILFSSATNSLEMMREYNTKTISDIVNAQIESGNVIVDKVLEKIVQFFPPVSSELKETDLAGKNADAVISTIRKKVDDIFSLKVKEVDERVATSAASGGGGQSAITNSLGRSANYIILITMDNAWSDHLQAMENLKESVVLRQYQGKDPLTEYQTEAFTLFQGLEDIMRNNAVYSLWQSLATTTTTTPSKQMQTA